MDISYANKCTAVLEAGAAAQMVVAVNLTLTVIGAQMDALAAAQMARFVQAQPRRNRGSR